MTHKLKRSDFSTLLVNRYDNGLVVVTLNRPEVGNAVNTEMGIELLDCGQTLSVTMMGFAVSF